MIKSIRKRDGRLVPFNPEKITEAVFKATKAVGKPDRKRAGKITRQVVAALSVLYKEDRVPTVENVQDLVERMLIEDGYADVAKAYILYREQHAKLRETKTLLSDAVLIVDRYLGHQDWRVRENSNMSYSLQGLNNHIFSLITSNYWLSKLYPQNIRDAHIFGDIHIHDIGVLSVYCCGWDLKDLLIRGFGGASGKVESSPPKHFRSALGQIVNFFYTLQGEAAGAQAFSFDAQTPITIKRNGEIESITLEMLFEDYKHHLRELNNSEVIFGENIYRRYLIEEADKRKYLDKRMPTEPVLFQFDKIEVLTEGGFVPLKAISRHSVQTDDDKLLAIETEDGNILKVSRSHPMVLADKTIKRADELKIGEEILSSDLNPSLTEKIELQSDFAYLIGFLISEGCWGHQTKEYSLISQKKNTKEREKIESILRKLRIPYFEDGKFNVVFSTTSMGRFIRNHLRLQGGSHRKNLPLFVFSLKKENIGDLISGLIDGDGDIDREKICRIHSTSYTLLMQLKQILGVLGIKSTVRLTFDKHSKENHKDAYIIRFRIDAEHLSLFKQSIKLQNIKPKVKESPKFSSKVVKIVDAKNDNGYIYDITTENEHFLINNIVVHNSNFDTLLSPFIRYDGLSYKETKQCIQEFVFNMNIPTRVGFQTPFTNITMDVTPPRNLSKEYVIIGGKPQDTTYSEFKKEILMINKAFCEVMGEGDAKGRIFTFPIPTYNITSDFNWDDENLKPLWEITAKYGIPYFSNFINSDMDPEDARSMCCRLRLDNRELRKRGGGLFGSNPLTGSIGVVTINLPRIAYKSEGDEGNFFERLGCLMEIAKESLEIKRKVIERFTDEELYPYARYYLTTVKERFGAYWKNHFSTIGLIGMNEACLNLIGSDIASPQGKALAIKTLRFMRERILKFQKETDNLYNIEATPAEGAAYRLAMLDKEQYEGIITAGTKKPYYTNSTHLPVGYTDDIFTALLHQDELQALYTGGTVFHGFLGEKIDNPEMCKRLVKRIAERFSIPYYTLTPTFSICPIHGYIRGEHFTCPRSSGNGICNTKCEVYSRVVGYYRPIQQWNDGKQEEFYDRREYKI